jgi:hypothetical protein
MRRSGPGRHRWAIRSSGQLAIQERACDLLGAAVVQVNVQRVVLWARDLAVHLGQQFHEPAQLTDCHQRRSQVPLVFGLTFQSACIFD